MTDTAPTTQNRTLRRLPNSAYRVREYLTDTESHELVRPLAQSDGHDAPRLIDELVPGFATMVDEIVV